MTNFNWDSLVGCAERLKSSFDDETIGEASCRSAISRCYYAAYHTARIFAEDKLNYRAGASPHRSLLKLFQGSHNDRYKKVGNQLKQLRKKRITADYYDHFRGNYRATARKTIFDAKKIIGAVNSL